ncbi:hypothetical protein F4678DRAFT_425058 [Xylaria arbuscula]|nr:hypothetical protein F4678DRAFT_425058 [Xylaria arbuscula]
MEQEYTGERSAAAKPKAKLAHRDPERRRLQNQKAQKKYREKQRQRINDLENLAANIGSGAGEDFTFTQDVQSHLSHLGISENDRRVSTLAPVRATQYTDPTADRLINLEAAYVNDYITVGTDNSLGPLTPNFLAEDGIASHPSLTRQPWDTSSSTHDHLPRQAWKLELVDCGCQVLHIQIRAPSGPDSNQSDHVSHTLAFFDFPDPYINTLRLERLCTVQALNRNCMMIGITAEMYCLADSVSPFFRHITHNTSADEVFIRSVQGIFETLKPDLRPCPRQITVGHHPYIDVLPFPTVRANLIGSIGSIDEDDFFVDCLSGLICWGGTGVSRQGTTGGGTGTPWDTRSWEAKQWFIQKWWLILGGEEGEVVQQSKWWRALRGEDESLMIS